MSLLRRHRLLSLDAALNQLNHSPLPVRQIAWRTVQRHPRETVAARMVEVRPLPVGDGATLIDSLGLTRVWRHAQETTLAAEWAVAVACSAGYEAMTLTMIESLRIIGRLSPSKFPVVIFALDNGAYQHLRALGRTDIIIVRFSLLPSVRASPWIAVARWLAPQLFPGVKRWFLVEADMLARRSLAVVLAVPHGEVTQAVDAAPVIGGVRPQVWAHRRTLLEDCVPLQIDPAVIGWVFGDGSTAGYFCQNGGLQAGTGAAFSRLHEKMCSGWPYTILFCQGIALPWGEEVLLSLALDRLRAAYRLDDSLNHQVYNWCVGMDYAPATFNGCPVRLQHFPGIKTGFWRTSRYLGIRI